jgi:ubiquinone/menaquinone biosynthesis C-methylase UbiE
MHLNEIQQASQEQFARQSHRYGSGHILENIEDVRAAAETIPLPARARVLDIATGAGHTALFFAALGHDVTAADIAPPMLERVREAACKRGLPITTRLHPAEKLPYADGEFALVTCRVAAHHFSSPPDFVRETARVLARDGHFLLIDGSVADDQPEAEAWIHEVEKLRDPSHNRFLTPRAWSELCERNGLAVQSAPLTPFKQPDLNWYFETAATPAQNREQVRRLIESAPAAAHALFQIAEEDGRTVWWWQRLTLIAKKG